ncbi:alpha/beta fold hydrolase [Acaryochloris marina]|uniref:Proline iminopeptidase n=1 Tax=Acaryochloris marina (strain MBIC 11017) TaxID=329726 RepID=B0C386_ACAM1|nr:alpha/beta hydrolase [Acaryochloris marina]ABW28585.1 proline iminopeptidase [Acaryochloris marina MBIC11017]BDM77582.1 alpha/beta hydrolase [Acaryochloris marina MBIC10699]
MRARIRDTELYFDVEGSELAIATSHIQQKPVFFVIHGGPGVDHTTCRPVLSPLSEIAQLVYFDHRGHGRSARGNPETYTLDNNVEDLEALRQHLGLERIGLLGFSYGGMVALAYASRYPRHVSQLIPVVTAADSRFLALAQAKLAKDGTPEQQAIAQLLWDGKFESEQQLQDYFQLLGPLYSLTFDLDKSMEAWRRVIFNPEAINQAFGGFLRTYDIRADLPQICAPTLVIGAEQDWICPPQFSEEIAQAIPKAKLGIIPNSGHSVRADAPEKLLELISNFVKGV